MAPQYCLLSTDRLRPFIRIAWRDKPHRLWRNSLLSGDSDISVRLLATTATSIFCRIHKHTYVLWPKRGSLNPGHGTHTGPSPGCLSARGESHARSNGGIARPTQRGRAGAITPKIKSRLSGTNGPNRPGRARWWPMGGGTAKASNRIWSINDSRWNRSVPPSNPPTWTGSAGWPQTMFDLDGREGQTIRDGTNVPSR